ncbi:IclR family transcriptional regulator [Pseudonocardiaceae bacterium YIM PH 21723]|nr:IclR family transcriptional regulator [Pseudonocardiaceae bacterium YIM PH 21723]
MAVQAYREGGGTTQQTIPDQRRPDDPGGVLAKAFAMLETLGQDGRPVGLSALSRRAGVPKSTAHRLLQEMLRQQVVERRGQDYALGRRLEELASAASGEPDDLIRAVAMPFLVDLHGMTGGVVSFGVLQGTGVRFLERLHGHRFTHSPAIGRGRPPAHCTAIGKVLLAYEHDQRFEPLFGTAWLPMTPQTITTAAGLENELSEIRRTGIAFDRQEFVRGLLCVASPVLAGQGRLPLALSVGDEAGRLNLTRVGTHVRRTAFAIGAALRRLQDQD